MKVHRKKGRKGTKEGTKGRTTEGKNEEGKKERKYKEEEWKGGNEERLQRKEGQKESKEKQ